MLLSSQIRRNQKLEGRNLSRGKVPAWSEARIEGRLLGLELEVAKDVIAHIA